MNKKILISLSVIGVVSAIVIGGTVAFFSDTETSTGNTLTAGTLNLKVGDNDPTSWNFQVGYVKPGDSGFREVTLQNTGSLEGYLHITFANLINDDMSCPEPEQNEGGDTTCGVGQVGELAENLDILVYLDENSNDAFNLGIDTLIYQGKVKGILQGDLFDYLLLSGISKDLRIEWKLDSVIGNIVQTDKTGFDILFELTQKPKGDLVGDWHLNENSGSVVYDSALTPANNGTIYNGAVWTNGKYNPALSFDGVNDYVQIPNDSNLQINKTITLSLWIKTPASWNMAYPTPISKAELVGTPPNHDWNGEYWIAIRSSDSRFTFTFAPTGGSAIDHWSSSTLAFNAWYHIVATFDDNANKVRLYLNGVLDKEFTENATPGITNLPVKIGHGGYSNNYFKGIVDEVRIYNRVLSDAEISEIYQKGL